MSCNCEPKKYSIGMGCCVPVLAPIENYYTKHQVDQLIEEIESAITSGCCITPEEVDDKIDVATSGIDQNIDAISGDVITISGDLQAVSAEVESISGLTSGDVQTMIDESVSGKQDTLIAGDNITIVNNVISAASGESGISSAQVQTMIDESISGKADSDDVYTKDEVDQLIEEVETSGITSATCQTMIDQSISGKADYSDFSAHTANTTVHITSAERTTWNEKANLWTGTKEQYDAIPTKDANTIYLIHD